MLKSCSVNRTEFEVLRDLPGKVIKVDIKLSNRQATRPALVAENIEIENGNEIDLRLNITYNPETGGKTFNVHVPGIGPICRLDVDGPAHRPAGRSHKHSLQAERDPDRNLPDGVMDRPDLAGQDLRAVFREFCRLAAITHHGSFFVPGE